MLNKVKSIDKNRLKSYYIEYNSFSIMRWDKSEEFFEYMDDGQIYLHYILQYLFL